MSTPDTLLAPFKGINSRDMINNLKPGEATDMVNLIPFADRLTLRKGHTNWATGFAQPPKTLMPYNSPNAVSKLFAAASNGVFDITAGGAIGGAAVACTFGEFIYTNFQTSAGAYLVAVNGTDNLKLYDGTNWVTVTAVSTPAITGPATTTFKHVMAFKQRLHFLANGYAGFYWLPVGQVGGAATAFPVGQYLKKGGSITAQASWTVDGGDGSEDRYVLISSEGEVLLFTGTDPSNPTLWNLTGRYDLARPLGPNCTLQLAGDLIVLTEAGVLPISKSLIQANASYKTSISDKVNTKIRTTALLGANWRFQLFNYLKGPIIIVNTPDAYGMQYVVNTETGAWTRFNGWKANAFLTFGNDSYMALDTSVQKLFTSATDAGTAVYGRAITAYNYFNTQSQIKTIEALRCLFLSSGPFNYGVLLLSAFELADATIQYNEGVSGASVYDVALWDTATWAGDTAPSKAWITPPHNPDPALALAIVMTSSSDLSWLQTDYLYEMGDVLAG